MSLLPSREGNAENFCGSTESWVFSEELMIYRTAGDSCAARMIGTTRSSGALQNHHLFRHRQQKHAPSTAPHGVFSVMRRIEVVAGRQAMRAEMDLAFEHEDFFSGGVIVGRIRCTGI